MCLLCCFGLTLGCRISSRREGTMCFVQTTADSSLSGCDVSNSFDEETALYQQEMKTAISNPKISEFKTWLRFGRCVVLCFVSMVKASHLRCSSRSTNLKRRSAAIIRFLPGSFLLFQIFRTKQWPSLWFWLRPLSHMMSSCKEK